MSINDIIEKVKPFYIPLLILLVSFISFALGRLSALEERYTPIQIRSGGATEVGNVVGAIGEGNNVRSEPINSTASTGSLHTSDEVIGTQSKKYYFPWCGTIKRVKPENQIHFQSIEAARAAGFLPGGNCKGLR